MKNNCYFCDTNVEHDQEHGAPNYYCNKCAMNNDLESVITTIVDKKVKFGHIYFIKNDRRYHIRLHIQENSTAISIVQKPLEEIIIPGITLNPSNVKVKLSTYLLFS